MKLGQVIEYRRINIFPQKIMQEMRQGDETSSRPFAF